MLIFMFLSSFFAQNWLPSSQNANFGRKISKNFAHTQARNIFFLIKSHNLPLFALFFRFFLQLSRKQSTGLRPIYSEANYHLQLALRAIYYPPLLFRYQLRYIYDRYTNHTNMQSYLHIPPKNTTFAHKCSVF